MLRGLLAAKSDIATNRCTAVFFSNESDDLWADTGLTAMDSIL